MGQASEIQTDSNQFKGWSSEDTMLMALDIGNHEETYKIARLYRDQGYIAFATSQMDKGKYAAPCGVSYGSFKLDIKQLDELMRDL